VAPTYGNHSYPLVSSRAEYAHAAGLTGAGQFVSVVDEGFLLGHEVFQVITLDLTDGYMLPVNYHGTAVASIIGGDSSRMIGMAPGVSLQLNDFSTVERRTQATWDALTIGAVAQNNSWGDPAGISETSFQSRFDSDSGARYFAALDAYAAEGIVVFAASNDPFLTTATLMEALPAVRPSLEAGWLAVVSGVPTFDNDSILSVDRKSAPCLEAARWCMVADGAWRAATAESTSSYGFMVGTSFAAPQVSGALALLGEAFPDLTPHELRIRLLASADNTYFAHDNQLELAEGFYHGYNEEFGHGFLDIRAALLPIGEMAMTMSDGTSYSLESPVILAGGASGDALVSALSSYQVVAADAFGGGFSVPGDALVASRSNSVTHVDLDELMSGDLTRRREGEQRLFNHLAESYGGQSISVLGPDLAYTLSVPNEDKQDGTAVAVSFIRTFETDRLGFDLGVSLAQEDGSLLGVGWGGTSTMTEAVAVEFGLLASLSTDISTAVRGQFGNSFLPEGGPFDSMSDLTFNSLSAEIHLRNAFRHGDSFGFSVSLPTAVVGGSATMVLPMSRSAGLTVYDTLMIPMAPEDRQVDMTVSYLTSLGGRWEAVFEAVRSLNSNNRSGEYATAAGIGFTMSF